MAITFVAAGSIDTGANPSVTVPAGYQANDLLLIVTTGSTTPTTPSGWTLLAAQGTVASNVSITVLYKFAASSESSVALTMAGTTSKAVMIAYRGVLAADALAAFTTDSGTSISTASQTTTVDGDQVISVFGVQSGATRSWSGLPDGTSRVESNGTASFTGMAINSATKAVAGATSPLTATISSNGNLSSFAFSFSPSSDSAGNFFFLF
jgi:hypothetical protein